MIPPGADVDSWRLLAGDDVDVPCCPGAANMALDRALLEAVRDGAPPTLRLYRWSPATLSFGRNQPAAGLYEEHEAAIRGIDFVRRPTGGQAVLHDDELTYAVIAPVVLLGKPRAAYRAINRALVAGLRSLGLDAALAGETVAGTPRAWLAACFRAPAPGEVVVRGRKLVGSAQRVESRTVLQHGSILVGGSQAAAEDLLVDRAAVVAGSASDDGWTTMEAELGRRPEWGELSNAIARGFEAVLGIRLAPAGLTVQERERARRLESRFASEAWTWRR